MSYSAFSNAANKICRNADNESKSIGGGATANAASAAGIRTVLTITDKAISQLKALSGPGALESARDKFVAVGNSTVVLAKKAEAAATAGNQAAYSSAVNALNATDPASNAAGNQLGAPACATSD